MKLRILSLAVALFMLAAVLSGCAGTAGTEASASAGAASPEASQAPAETQAATASAEPAPAETQAAETQAEPASETYTLPLTTDDVTLTMFAISNSNVTNQIGELNNHQVYKKAVEVTGINVNITTVAQEASEAQFALVLASGDYPDMVRSGKYTNGITAAWEEDIVIELTDLIGQYAPHYSKILSENPVVSKNAKTDDGKLLAFYMLNANGDEFAVPCLNGPIIRQDLLQTLGSAVPTTLDELHDVLLAFKTEFSLPDPLYLGNNAFGAGFLEGAYGIYSGLYQVDGAVKFGPLEDGFKDYLAMLSQWYGEGILNSDFYGYDDNPMSSVTEGKKTGGDIGVFSAPASNMYAYCGDTVTYVGMPMMPGPDGGNHVSGDNTVVDTAKGMTITSDCENVEMAVRWCDFWYSEPGRLLSNYGIEDVSFTYDGEGKPRWTDLITNNPDGLSLGICRQVYTTLTQQPGVCPKDLEINLLDQTATDAVALWNATGDSSYVMPAISLTSEESARAASLLADIDTLGDETWNKILMGQESIDAFDSYLEEIRTLGIDEVLSIYQTALDRYNAR